ncbi:MAG: tetratricopeptide repeat protein [Cyclobacteriaceae bacterium]|nr:tetratricopeptide repeat protein [Cyclobacteriaceae bacterium]
MSCLLMVPSGYGQLTNSSDSLESLYLNGAYEAKDKLGILKELAINHPDAEKKLAYSQELIQSAEVVDSPGYVFQGLLEKGNALRLKSDLSSALQTYFDAAQIANTRGDSRQLGVVYVAIADVYAIMGNHRNAVNYHQNAIQILREQKDTLTLASALLNAGDEYINFGKLDSALIYTLEAESMFDRIEYPLGEAYSLGNMGMIYAMMGNDAQAEKNMSEAIELLEQQKEYYPIAVYLNYIADIYLEKGEQRMALSYARRSLELAQENKLKQQVSEAYLKLAEIYEKIGDAAQAFRYYRSHITYKDSVNNIASVQQMADLRTNFEVSKKQIEVDLLNQQKRNQQIIIFASVIAAALIALLAFSWFRRYRYIRETSQIIERERSRSESLLLNILPRETAQELKDNGKVQAKRFDSVSVLFADFKGFTQYAEQLRPEQLVESLDRYFSRFDEIAEHYGLEKIKTLGDAYMCAAGLPFPKDDHAHQIVLAALEMQQVAQRALADPSSPSFELRVGISTGPVVAGVVGTKKFAYDIWGDTVNIASRMETNSEPGKINISETTYALIKDRFRCTYRGELDVKNKGKMRMYFVEGVLDSAIA